LFGKWKRERPKGDEKAFKGGDFLAVE